MGGTDIDVEKPGGSLEKPICKTLGIGRFWPPSPSVPCTLLVMQGVLQETLKHLGLENPRATLIRKQTVCELKNGPAEINDLPIPVAW